VTQAPGPPGTLTALTAEHFTLQGAQIADRLLEQRTALTESVFPSPR
jgi:hypothetical protein